MAFAKDKLPVRSRAQFLESLEDAAVALPTINPRRTTADVLPPEPRTLDEYAAIIQSLFKEAEDRFVLIGSFLERAKDGLPHGEFQRLVTGRLPFSPRAAQMMMAASRAIRTGIVPPNIAPPSYSIVYQISTLSDAERERAVSEGVIRPDMRRQDLERFKRRLRDGSRGREDRRAALVKERDRLRRLLTDIEREIRALDDPASES